MTTRFLQLTALLPVLAVTFCLGVPPRTAKTPVRPRSHHPKTIAPASDIKLPAGFSASIVAEDLGSARHIAISKTGDIYVKLAKLKDGKGIYRLRDTNSDGVIDEQHWLWRLPRHGHCAQEWVSVCLVQFSGVYRYKLNEKGEVASPDQPELMVTGLRVKPRDVSEVHRRRQSGQYLREHSVGQRSLPGSLALARV